MNRNYLPRMLAWSAGISLACVMSASAQDLRSDGTVTFNCASQDARYQECRLPTDGRVELVRRWSEAQCREGYSWGVRGDRLWVDHGCRAEFQITPGRYSNVRPNPNTGRSPYIVNSGQQQRAQVQCRNEARHQGINVRDVTAPRFVDPFWRATVHGDIAGRTVTSNCRFDPIGNETTVFVDPSYGRGWGVGSSGNLGRNDRDRAERACLDQAARLGYRDARASTTHSGQYGAQVALQLSQGNRVYNAACDWDRRSGRVDIEQVLPRRS